jgi:LacI family transcriptional regulator
MPGSKSGIPTLADVARAAGVSPATASRIANGRDGAHRIAPATAARVQAAIVRLGYRANPQARALRIGRPQAVGLLAWTGMHEQWWHPWHIRLLAGVETTLQCAGYDPLLLGVHRPGGRLCQPAVEALTARRVSGIISLIGLEADEHRELLQASAGAFAVLLQDAPARQPAFRCDLGPGIDAACAHLARLGHGRVAWVDHRRTDRRHELVHDAARRHHLALERVDLGPMRQFEDGLEAVIAPARRKWDSHDAPAVLAGSDLVAMGVLASWRARGLRVPEDRSLIGIDDLQACLCQPQLTSVSQAWEEIGAAAARHVLAVLDGGEPGPLPPIPSRLIIRASCAPPRSQP